jgi:hypothetical protein
VIEHARVVLLRPSPSGYEMLLLRRNEATQLPGGGIHDGEDARVGAARTVFEDCGVLLARDIGGQAETLEVPTFATLRRKIRGGANATELLRTHGLTWSSEALMPWSHWLMPAIHQSNALATLRDPGTEPAPTSTRVCVAELPGGMRTAFAGTACSSNRSHGDAAGGVAKDVGDETVVAARECL